MFVDIDVDPDEVDNRLEKAMAAIGNFDQQGERRKQAAATIVAASCLVFKKEFQQGMQLATGALDLCSTYGIQEAEPAATCVVAKAQIALDGPEEALVTAKRALRHFQDMGSKKGEASALRTLATVQAARYAIAISGDSEEYTTTKGLKEAETQMVSRGEEAAQLYRTLGDGKKEAGVWKDIMEAYLMKEDYIGALQAGQMAVTLYDNSKALKEKATAQLAVTEVYLAQREYDKVLDTATAALEGSIEAGDAAGEGRAMEKMLGIYIMKSDVPNTLATAKKMVAAYQKTGDTRMEAKSKLTAAQAYLALGKPDLAGGLSGEAFSSFMSIGDRDNMKLCEGTAKKAQQMINDKDIISRWTERKDVVNMPDKLYYGEPDRSWLSYDDLGGLSKGVN